MLILAIETSCDETSAAVLRGPEKASGPDILSNIILSQDEIHAPYGGVVPELASRQHIRTIDGVVGESLGRAGVGLEEIGLYAVTQGPGLIGSLLVGLSFAKSLAYFFSRPLIGINHLEAHLEAAFIDSPDIPYPSLGLLVSGGHTSLYFLKEPLSYELLGKTRDDAAGEALDKVAKHLGLGYPGGPVIEKLARDGDPKTFAFAVPRTKDRSLDFSFSGLKTAALKHIRQSGIDRESRELPDFLASFEEIVARALIDNLERGADQVNPQSLLLCGGVARNTRLRTRFKEFARESGLPAFVPSPKLCTDNAGMIGALAFKRFMRGDESHTPLTLDAYARSQGRGPA